MGEEGNIIEFYSGNCTIVFWNLDDYPVPNDTDLSAKSPIRSNIELALRQMGFHGYARIKLLGEERKYDSGVKTRTERLVYIPKGTPAYNTVDMTYYILLTLENNTVQGHSNAAVLAKPNAELRRILGCMKSRGHNVVLMEPPPYAECFFSVDSLVDNARLIDGGMPRAKKALTLEDLREDDSDPRPYISVEEEEDDYHPSKEMVDFSVRTIPLKGHRTIIFWDAIDCPFPRRLTFHPPHILYRRIRSSVLARDFIGNVSVWAYVKKDSEVLKLKKTWASNIYFFPGENEAASRRIRMFNDMQLLSRDSPVRPADDASLILVSDHFMGDDSYMKEFLRMRYRDYYLAMVVPSEQPGNHVKRLKWPGFLMDEAYHWRPCPPSRGGY